ncbi:ATP-binding protein [candidate division KSB1 bacterium]|nr:ATP-binding protein [candidate division KSB1 bacterium]
MMENELVHIDRRVEDVTTLTPLGSMHDISLIPALLAAFEAEFEGGVRFFILDFTRMQEFLPSLVALVYELTGRARRYGGDVCLTHLNTHARQGLLHFDPETYLLLTASESEALAAVKNQPAVLTPERETPLPEASTHTTAQEDGIHEIEIPSRVDALYRSCDFVTNIARRLGFPESELSKIKISVYEACLNVIEHAYHSDPGQRVRVQVINTADRMTISVLDQGDGFTEEAGEDFDVMAAAAARRTGGMGLHIIRRSMDKVSYVRDAEKGNQLIMVKYLQHRVPSETAP